MKIAIIGSGLAGATLAHALAPKHDVTVFEKSHGSSGRMSTRRRKTDDGAEYAFDHGAQYFTIKGERFQKAMAPYLKSGVVQLWQGAFVNMAKDGATSSRETEAYVASPGMTGLAKAMMGETAVKRNVEINAITRDQSCWVLGDKNGDSHSGFDRVITAIPAVQTAALMPDDFANAHDLSSVKMMACFTVMLGFSSPLDMGFSGAFVKDSPIGFIAVNSTKPSRAENLEGRTSLVVQANNQWAEPRIDDDPIDAEKALRDEFLRLTAIDPSQAQLSSFHRWRYAATETPLGKAFCADDDRGLYAIGDWCIKGRVEAAFDSAMALADHFSQLDG